MVDSRSLVVKEACEVITCLVTCAPDAMELHVRETSLLAAALFKLSYVTIRIMSDTASTCLVSSHARWCSRGTCHVTQHSRGRSALVGQVTKLGVVTWHRRR